MSVPDEVASGETSRRARGYRPDAHRLLRLFAILAVSTAGGCSSLVGMVEWPVDRIARSIAAETGSHDIDPVELQLQLMRFSDSFRAAMIGASDRLQQAGKPLAPKMSLGIKVRYTEEVLAVTTGPNPFANLLDMVVLVTMIRLSIQDYWMPRFWGRSAEPLLAICRERERLIWGLASGVLQASEQDELRKAIRAWRATHPALKTLDQVRATGFATEIAKYGQANRSSTGSVFDLLQIDPLADLDPATREIAQTRHLAERAMFLAERMPTLLRWQSELLAMSIAELPETHQMLGDTGRLADSAARLSSLAQQLPGDIARERGKLIEALHSQESSLGALAGTVRQTLRAGNEMAVSTDAAMKTFAGVYAQLDAGSKDPHAKPVRIEDYQQLLAQVATTAIEINQTLRSIETLAAAPGLAGERRNLERLAADIERRGDRLLDRLIRIGGVLIALACAGLFVSLLAYRLAASRLLQRQQSGTRR